MLCALTVRTLKPDTFDQFRDAFMAPMRDGAPPEGWVRFNMVRNAENPNEVICFGFFDGSIDELRAQTDAQERQGQQQSIDEYVESTGADGLYEVVEDLAVDRAG